MMIGMVMALYFISQYHHFNYPLEDGVIARLWRTIGISAPKLVFSTPHVNSVASFLEGIFILGLVLVWQARGYFKVGWGLVVFIIGCGLLLSESRGAWLGVIIALGVWGMLRLPNIRLRIIAFGLTSVGMILIITFISLLDIFQPVRVSLQNAAQSRLIVYRNSLYLFLDYAFTGIGPGDTFSLIYSKYQLLIPYVFLTYAHNLFLSVGLAFGILGLVALFWLIVEFYSFVLQAENAGAGNSRQSGVLFRGAWLAATAIFLHGLTDSRQFAGELWTMPVLFMVMGVAVSSGRPVMMQREKLAIVTPSNKSYQQWLSAAVIAAVLIVAGFFFRHTLLGMWYANLGAVYQTQADLSPALDETAKGNALAKAVTYFEYALVANPSQPVANRRLGMIALDNRQFDKAIAYLQQAYKVEPGNQATLKALGLAYVWTGQLDAAEILLRQRDDLDAVIGELGVWSWWWSTQDREDLSQYADEMASRLSSN